MYRATVFFLSALTFAAEPNETARKLLDDAAAAAASVNPEIHVLSLMHLGRTYPMFDKRKAVDFFRQAFAAAPAASEDNKDALQSEIVKWLADLSLPDAKELLRAIAEPALELEGKTSAIDRVVQLLLAKADFEGAAEAIGLVPESAVYPFRAATRLLDQLPKDDSRRIVVFGRATTAYKRRPDRQFTEMLFTYWRKVPREVAQAGLDAVIDAILVKKDESFNFEGDTPGDDGKMILKNRRTAELAQVYQVLDGLDPKRAQQLKATNPELKTAAAQPAPEVKAQNEPKDTTAPEDDEAFAPPLSIFRVGDLDAFAERIGKWALAQKKAEDAVALADKDLQQALSGINDLPYPGMKAASICGLAKKFAAKDQAAVRSLFDKCMNAVSDIKDPSELPLPLLTAAEAAHAVNRKELAWDAMQKAFVAASEQYAVESNAEKKNKVIREYWPSLQTGRVLAYRAATLLGADAETLLRDVRELDMTVVMRIEMARALMKEPHSVHHISFRF